MPIRQKKCSSQCNVEQNNCLPHNYRNNYIRRKNRSPCFVYKVTEPNKEFRIVLKLTKVRVVQYLPFKLLTFPTITKTTQMTLYIMNETLLNYTMIYEKIIVNIFLFKT